MTRPLWLPMVALIVVVTLVLALVTGLGLIAIGWPGRLGGVLAGALMLTFDAKTRQKKNGV